METAKYRITLEHEDGSSRMEEFVQDSPLDVDSILRLEGDNVNWSIVEVRDGNDG
jgi:hypothetical protein